MTDNANFDSTGRPILPNRSLATLPYSSLSWRDFELFVAELVSELPGFESVQNYGAFPDNQHGVDILSRHEGTRWAFQCKRVGEFGVAAFQRVVRIAKFNADHFVLALSCRAGTRLIDAVCEAAWELWDSDGLDRKVRSLSDPFDLVADYFGRAVAKAFLGRQRPGVFLKPSDYFTPYVRRGRAEDLSTPLVDRIRELEMLRAFYTDPHQRVLVISGPPGVGKTKLLYELTRSIPESEELVRFARAFADIDDSVLDELPAAVTTLVIDDDVRGKARMEDLASAILRTREKLVLVVRAGDAATLVGQLQELGYDSDGVVSLGIDRLSQDAVAELVTSLLPSGVEPLGKAIYGWSSGIPLVVQVITYLINEGHHDLFQALNSTDYPVAMLIARYAEVLAGKIAQDQAVSRDDVLSVLRLMAVVAPRDIRTLEFRNAATHYLDWPANRLAATVHALEVSGILLRTGSKARIIPELVALYILRDACAMGSIRTDFAERVIQRFGYDRQVLLNLAAVDHLDPAAHAALQPVWLYLGEQVRASTAFDRVQLLEELNDVGYLLPRFMMNVVEYVLRNPAAADDEQPWQEIYRFDQSDVLRKLPTLLRSIARSDIELLPRCVQLLWELGRDEVRRFGSDNAFDVLTELASYSRYTSGAFILTVLNEVERINASPEEQQYRHFPIELAAPALATSYDDFESHGASVTLQRRGINPVAVASVRAKAVDIMAAALNGAQPRAAHQAAKYLCDALQGASITSPEATSVQAREQDRIFDLFSAVRANARQALLTAHIASLLSWHAQSNRSVNVRTRATETIAGLEGTPEFDWYAALIPDIARHMPSVQLRAEFRQMEESINALLNRVVDRSLAERQDPGAFARSIANTIAEAKTAGLNTLAAWLFIELSNREINYAKQVADVVIDEFASELGDAISPILCAAWSQEPRWFDRAIAVIVSSNDQKLLLSVANALWMRRDAVGNIDDDADRRMSILRALIESGDATVKEVALRAIGTLLAINRRKAIDLILTLDVGGDAAIADELFANLRTVAAEELGEAGIERMLDYLATITELDYWAMEFLRQLSRERADDVLNLLMRRIERSDGLSARDAYKPIPYGHAIVPHEVQFFDDLQYSSNAIEQALRGGFALGHRGRYWLAELISNLARRPQPLFAAFADWAASDNHESQLVLLAEAMHRIPAAVIFDHADLVITIVDRAAALSEETGRKVNSAFFSAMTTGLRTGAPFQPMPEDVTMIERAKMLRSSLNPGAPAYKLFDEIVRYGDERVAKQLESDIDAFGEPQ